MGITAASVGTLVRNDQRFVYKHLDHVLHAHPYGTLIARKLPTGAHEYYEHLDNLGSVTGIDNSAGTSVETKAYDPYGNLTTNTSTTQPDPFGYAAGYTNPYGSLIHYGMRWYDPGIQRWTQPDQLNLPFALTSNNPFGYADIDPVNLSDPNGQSLFGCLVGIVAASYGPGVPNPYKLAAGCVAGSFALDRRRRRPVPRWLGRP